MAHKKSLAKHRKEYRLKELSEKGVNKNPFQQFHSWFLDVAQLVDGEINAMALATADKRGHPSVRQLLLKGYDLTGFVFFTNYDSRKGRELKKNPYAALLFYWPDLERQVRIEGKVEKISSKDSDAYFQTRPRGSQLGALVSPQSEVVENRAGLEMALTTLDMLCPDGELPRPPHWGGYRLVPTEFEYWQGRENRLHDRLRYRKTKGKWKIERLAP